MKRIFPVKQITRWCGFFVRRAYTRRAFLRHGFIAFLALPLLTSLHLRLDAADGTSGDADEETSPAVLLEVEGAIGPAIDDYIGRAFESAEESEAPVVIIRMNTPGGLDTSMRAIIRKILDSPIPVAVYIAPEGARGASAGTYILYAAHVAAMAPATSVGAATPVQISGSPGGGGRVQTDGNPEEASGGGKETEGADGGDQAEADGETADPSSEAMRRKAVNDAVSYLRGLAELRGRNAEWAEEAVRQGVTLTASEALEKNVIDFRVPDVEALLAAMDGLSVEVGGRGQVLETEGRTVRLIETDWRTELLSILTNPNVAYILMLLGIYGIIFEFSNPGSLVPGIAGAICLLLALFAFHLLPVNYAGVALISLGILLMLAEAFAPSFGALGVGGIIAFVLGSILLIDTDAPGFELHPSVIIGVTIASAFVFLFVFAMALKAWRRPMVSGREAIIGAEAAALEDFEREGRVRLKGEIWKARTTAPLKRGDRAKVNQLDGLTVSVEPLENHQPEEKPS